MTLFFCLAVPSEVKIHIRSLLHNSIIITDANDTPIGRLTKRKVKKGNWDAYILRTNIGSEQLTGVYSGKLPDHREILYSGLLNIIQSKDVVSISFMLHWYKGRTREEVPNISKIVKLPFSKLHDIIFSLEEDVLYYIHKQYPFI